MRNAPVTVNPHPGETWGISHKAKPNKDNALHTGDTLLGLIPSEMRIIPHIKETRNSLSKPAVLLLEV